MIKPRLLAVHFEVGESVENSEFIEVKIPKEVEEELKRKWVFGRR